MCVQCSLRCRACDQSLVIHVQRPSNNDVTLNNDENTPTRAPETRHDVSKVDVSDVDDATSASSDVTEQQRYSADEQAAARDLDHQGMRMGQQSAFQRLDTADRRGQGVGQGAAGHLCSGRDCCNDDTLSENELNVDADTDVLRSCAHTPTEPQKRHNNSVNSLTYPEHNHSVRHCEVEYTPRVRHEIRNRERPQSMRVARGGDEDVYVQAGACYNRCEGDVRAQGHRLGYLDLEPASPALQPPSSTQKYNYIRTWARDVTVASNEHVPHTSATLRRQKQAYGDVMHAQRAAYSDDDESGSEALSPPHYNTRMRHQRQQDPCHVRAQCNCTCSCSDDVIQRRPVARQRERAYESEDCRGMRQQHGARYVMPVHHHPPPQRQRRCPSADRAYESDGVRGMRYPTVKSYSRADVMQGWTGARGFRNEAFSTLHDMRDAGSMVSYAPSRGYEHLPAYAPVDEGAHYMRMDGVRASQQGHVMTSRRAQTLQPITESDDVDSPPRYDLHVDPRRMGYVNPALRSLENVQAESVYSDAYSPPYTMAPNAKREVSARPALPVQTGRRNFEPVGQEEQVHVEEARTGGKENGQQKVAAKPKKKKMFGLCGGPMMLRKQKIKQQPSLYNK